MKQESIINMHRARFAILCFILFALPTISKAQQHLIINEFSQGTNGVKEYIELVVVGQRTCAGDSCADIRGWVVDDNNGWYGAGSGQGIATGHMRFSNDANWSCVPYGSIILLYNSADVNPSITLAADPTDANNDNVYVVPSTSTLLENTSTTPISPSSASYVYPAVAYSTGGDWSTIGLANGGDAVIITSAANLATAHHSIAYGSVTTGASATIYKSQSGTAKVYFLSDDQYNVAASYTVGNAPADETPGAANTAANAAWISGMLTNVGGTVTTNFAACIAPGGSYNFNGTLLTLGGVYYDTLSTTSGCDSILQLDLAVITPVANNSVINGCISVTYNGTTYTSSTIVLDTLESVLGCDSVYQQVVINIQDIVPATLRDTVSGCQTIVYKGVTYNHSQGITDTLRTPTGCDSVYRLVYLNIIPSPVITVTPTDATICKGQSVTLSAASDAPLQWVGYPIGNTITVSPDATTVYQVTASNELNCVNFINVPVYVNDFQLNLSYAPVPVEKGQELTLSTSANENYSILKWEPAQSFGNQTAMSQSITADRSFYALVVGQNDKGCTDTARIFVDVLPTPFVFVPSAFTPNGDGQNDYFTPRFIRDYSIKDFSIYNRWGQRVYNIFSTAQLNQGWDGSYNGKPCDMGTYYYLLSAESVKGELVNLKGDLLLVR